MSRRNLASLGLVILLLGCGGRRDEGDPDPGCRCEGAVPEGRLDVACGEMQCLGGVGYVCTGPMAASYSAEACATPGPDGGVPPGDDGGPPPPVDGGPTPATFTTFLEDDALGTVEDIWSASPTDVWFVTSGSFEGQIVHWTGGTDTDVWRLSDPLYAVYGTDATHVWVAGGGGTVASFDGFEGFDLASTSTSYALFDTWGDGSHRYVAGELFGQLYEADGDFSEYGGHEVLDGRGSRISGDTTCVAGTSLGMWVCTRDALYGYDGEWHHVFDGYELRRVHPTGGSLALVLEDGVVTLVNFREVALSGGFGPHSLPIPLEVERGVVHLYGLWGDRTEVWIAGTGGYLARMRSYTDPFADWERMDTGTTRDLHSISVDAGSIWVGGTGIIVRRPR